jgi:hypothetical protein
VCLAPKGKRRFLGRSRKKFRPLNFWWAAAARGLRGRFLGEGTGKAEPRSPAGRRKSTERVAEGEQGKVAGGNRANEKQD